MKNLFIAIISLILFSNQVWATLPDWLPTAGLNLHLSADCIETEKGICKSISDGVEVDTWYDQSGNNNDARATTKKNSPRFVAHGTGGKPVIRFNGVEKDGMIFSDNLNIDSLEYTIFIVDAYTMVGGKRGRLLHSRSQNDWFLGRWKGKTSFSSGGQVKRTDFENDSDINTFVISTGEGSYSTNRFQNNRAIKRYFRNGDLVKQANLFREKNDWTLLNLDEASLNPVTPGLLGLANHGGRLLSEELMTDGDVAEILIYKRQLSDGERNLVTRYLSDKYDIPLNRDSYTISFNYLKQHMGGGNQRKIVHLASVDSSSRDDSDVIFEKYLWADSHELQPEKVAWYIDFIDTNSPYFTLQNVKDGGYLTKEASMVKLNKSPLKKDNAGFLSYIDNALWSIRAMNNQGDVALINKATSDNTNNPYFLKNNQKKNIVQLQTFDDFTDPEDYLDKLFTLNERYIHLQIFPEDVFEYNDLLHLPNGLRVDSIFLPDYSASKQVRQFKLTVANHKAEEEYEFISHPGFDVLSDSLNDFQNSSVIGLKQRIDEMLLNKNFDNQTIKDSIMNQLSSAYKASQGLEVSYPFVPGILWFSSNNPDKKPEIFKDLETQIDVNGKYIKLKFKTEALTADDNFKFGIFMQSTEKRSQGGGWVGLHIYDPTVPRGSDPTFDPN